jgi:hypothetical protein
MKAGDYRKKHPGAKLISEEFAKVLSDKMKGHKGRTYTDEQKRQMSELKKKQFVEDPDYRKRISDGTKNGMHEEEHWKNFEESIKQRDSSYCSLNFKSDLPEIKAKIYTEERNGKISEKKTEWWSHNVGKTVEELYGEEVGKNVRETMSKRMTGENNPAFGKVYQNTGRIRGWYKGLFFRSSYEYSYYKKLEKEGHDLSDVSYEEFKIPYEWNGHKHTYIPDFFIKSEKKIVEIKSTYHIGIDNGLITTKATAAKKFCEQNGFTYEILTEKDVEIIQSSLFKNDPDVLFCKK